MSGSRLSAVQCAATCDPQQVHVGDGVHADVARVLHDFLRPRASIHHRVPENGRESAWWNSAVSGERAQRNCRQSWYLSRRLRGCRRRRWAGA